jgi:hypothetical protein
MFSEAVYSSGNPMPTRRKRGVAVPLRDALSTSFQQRITGTIIFGPRVLEHTTNGLGSVLLRIQDHEP